MTWVKIDDKLTSHPKWVGLTLEAKSLWFHAAVWCGSQNNDGRLPGDALPLIAFTASVPAHLVDDAATRLIKARLWSRTPKAAGGGFEIRNWLEYQPSRQQVKDREVAHELSGELAQLHDWLHKRTAGKRVKELINSRDCGWCRYCGEFTKATIGDRRSPHRKTYDLIDPSSRWDTATPGLSAAELVRIAELWATACGWCNAIKGHRTPDEAEMVLIKAPSTRQQFLPVSAPICPDLFRNGSGAGPEAGTVLPQSAADGSATGLDGPDAGLSGSADDDPDPGL